MRQIFLFLFLERNIYTLEGNVAAPEHWQVSRVVLKTRENEQNIAQKIQKEAEEGAVND